MKTDRTIAVELALDGLAEFHLSRGRLRNIVYQKG